MPTSMIAAISSEVATGRRMKTRDGFTTGSASRRFFCRFFHPGAAVGSLAASPAIAPRAFALRVFGLGMIRLGMIGRGRGLALGIAPLGIATGARNPHLGAVAQPIGAI